MTNKMLPDPNAMATSEEDIAAIFGCQEGEAFVLAEGSIVVVITADGQVMWMTNGVEVTPELIAHILACVAKSSAIKAVLNKLRRAQTSTTIDPPAQGGHASSTSPQGRKPGGGFSR